jgi:hypothetical protein
MNKSFDRYENSDVGVTIPAVVENPSAYLRVQFYMQVWHEWHMAV